MPVPGIFPSQATDGISPIALGRDPLPKDPCLVCEEQCMDDTDDEIQVWRVTSPSDQGHENCHIVDEPHTASLAEMLRSTNEGL